MQSKIKVVNYPEVGEIYNTDKGGCIVIVQNLGLKFVLMKQKHYGSGEYVMGHEFDNLQELMEDSKNIDIFVFLGFLRTLKTYNECDLRNGMTITHNTTGDKYTLLKNNNRWFCLDKHNHLNDMNTSTFLTQLNEGIYSI